jgi:Mrp family chromosome partitioning ATPase
MAESFSGLDGDGTWVGGPGLVGSLWRYRLVIAAVTTLAAIAGYAAGLLLPARYEAQANLYLRDPGSPAVLTLGGSSQSQSGDHAVFMATQAEQAGSDAVFGRALQVLGRSGTPDDVRRSVVVAPSADLASIVIRATSSDPADAADLANAVGTAYQQVSGERTAAAAKNAIAGLQQIVAQRQVEFDALQAQLARSAGPDQPGLQRKALHVGDLIGALQSQQSDIAAQAAVYGSGVESFLEAVPPTSSSQPAQLLLALFGAVVGLLATGCWAWWAAGRNRRVEADDDAGAILAVPLLGETPRLNWAPRGSSASSAPSAGMDPVGAEAYHFVLAGVEHALSKVGGKVVAVASAGSGDGKTVTVLHLAIAARQEGRKVMLVDGDERTRRLSQLCRDRESFDVIGVAAEGEQHPAVSLRRWPPTPGPWRAAAKQGSVLQREPSERNGHHPAVFFRSTSFGKLISSGEPAADLVLIDTPALLEVSEAVTIADQADAVVLVVSKGTPWADLRRARDRLAFTDTPLIGYLLNRGSTQRAYPGTRGRDGSTGRWLTHRVPRRR